MKHWRSGLTLTLGLISVAPLLHAAFSSTYTASPTVPVPTGCFPGPGDLQSCLDIAADDPQANMVVLQPGTYSDGPYNYSPGIDDDGGALVIMNEGATLPVLDGANSDTCLTIDNGGLPSDLGADITINGLVFQNCDASSDGGALDVNTIQAAITLENSNFFDNSTVDDDGGAAVLETESGTITVRNSLFERNETVEDGGGLELFSNTGNISVLESVFNDNIAESGGGGINASTNSGNITVQGNTFAGNDGGIIDNSDGGGARISFGTGDAVIGDNLFLRNSAGSNGGALSIISAEGGPGSLTIVNNIIAGNSNGNNASSTNTFGGGVSVFLFGTNLTLTNNTIFGNASQASDDAANGGGVSVLLGTDTTADVYNNIIFGNSAEANGGDIYSDEDSAVASGLTGGTLNLFNNDFTSFYSEALDNGGAGTVNQGNNIDADPLFVNAAGDDFNLTEGSPAIDSGDPSAPAMPATDFAGDPRPAIPGTNPDMGALEFQPEPTVSPTPTPTPPVPPLFLQGDGCSLQANALPTGAGLAWSWLLALGALAYRRRMK
ncbi:MAG: right-handed parallel beta-helix repeat-containing protein [Deltaproteobacteria bacterium]|nr:right-handed parallel beta-helix repeat-containing protein [Deltaproteobacteria bacterium]